MAEEVRLTGGEEDDIRVSEWEDGLPDGDDLTPLSQLLISSELLSAFSITPEPYRSMIDVTRASQNTLSSLRGESEQPLTGVNGLKPVSYSYNKRDAMDADGEEAADLASGGSDYRKLQRIGSSGDGYGDGGVETADLNNNGSDYRKLARIGGSGDGYGVETVDLNPNGSDYRKLARNGSSGDGYGDGGVETADVTPNGSDYRKLARVGSSGDGYVDGDSGGAVEETETEIETETEYDAQGGEASARVSKRQRLVWTPQLHKRFIEVVAHLGVKNAVPKTIMQLMNVEGLTRENVASHLQKYRLYLKRMHGNDSSGGNGYRPVQTPYSQQVHHVPYNSTAVQQRWYGNGNGNGNQHGMSASNK